MRLSTLVEQIINKQSALKKLVDKNLLQLNSLYSSNGYELRIVGGAVRDILMDKKPKDIDLASNATPIESMNLLQTNGIRVIETGLRHGTITAHIDGNDYEITTLRIDKKTDGRHAEVEFTRDWEQDAARRDLTFNAMSMDFNGNLYDYFGGHEDLKRGRAAFVGDTEKRIQEDYLRILRYFRFQGRTESPEFDVSTLDIIHNNIDGLTNISGERIWAEMQKILTGNNLVNVMGAMNQTGVMDVIGLKSDNLSELFNIKNNSNDPSILLSSLLSNVKDLDILRSKWKFSNPEYNTMKFIINNRHKNINYSEAKKIHIMNRIDKSLIASLFEYQGKMLLASKFGDWNPPVFPITGDDLKSSGLTPGPEMGRMLTLLKNKWVDSNFKLTKEELLNFI